MHAGRWAALAAVILSMVVAAAPAGAAIDPPSACKIERFHAITGLDHCVTTRFEQIVEELHVEFVVLNNHDGLGH